ncbi:glycosyltransferase family 9 protein [Bdellovibrio sp. NC01]|uniref:glycosyltransferase family 9 protein n=1 Tax=Bdellovibrio sp. NC01 TaxID=2220073 RepID=UPI0011590E55|nr:glycosyltransferase family 9 protein [Bdellovibrio sp. NC01]QDK36648.1 lipopolysaccharide heptosyltransferase-I [Bdellovibrio sp. NC01]
MKILVVSLLRLGDIIQQEPLLRGLRDKYPEAEIHLLVNKQFSSIERLLSGVVNRFITFDREALQRGLGEAEFNILWSYSQLENLVQSLNAEGYDQVLNFTHTKLSAYLIGAIDAKAKKGLHQTDGKFAGLENRWLRYFNDRFSANQKSLFHYVELLGKSFDIPVPKKQNEQRAKSKTVLLQCLTSNQKKNWGLFNFARLKRTIESALVDYKVQVLGASFERAELLEYFSDSDLLICDLPDAQKHLQAAALLVTGDTSIKHLAAQIGTPIVEIAIGSSDPVKTGAYSANAEVITTTVPCAPCGHAQGCTQKSHLCAEEITVDQVFAAVWDKLSGEKKKVISGQLDLDRAVWSLYLDKEHKDLEPYFFHAAQEFVHHTANMKELLAESQRQGQILTSWLTSALNALPSREQLLTKRTLQASEMSELILVGQDIIRSKQDVGGYFTGFLESLISRFSHPVQLHDRVLQALEEARELLEIRSTLMRYLESLSKEGGYYATGIGQLSIGGFEETRTGLQRTDAEAVLRRAGREIETFE